MRRRQEEDGGMESNSGGDKLDAGLAMRRWRDVIGDLAR
jgi:hypothetical protein